MKKKDEIRLHPEYGVNPSMLQCFACGGDAGIALLGYNGGKEAPTKMCTHDSVCQKCEEHMRLGVILIETRDGERGDNPFRTGRQWVVSEDFIQRTFEKDMADHCLKRRLAFIEKSTADMFGFDKVEPTMGHEDMGAKG